MASTPDLSADKEAGPSGFQRGFNNQYPSNQLLSSAGGRGRQESRKGRSCMPTDPRKRKWLFIGVPVALVVIAAIIIGVLVGVDQNNKPKSGSGSSAGSSTGTGSGGGSTAPTSTGAPGQDDTSSNQYITAGSGKTGGKAMTDLGVEFDFRNDFDGEWAQNPEDPYSVSIAVAHEIWADPQ